MFLKLEMAFAQLFDIKVDPHFEGDPIKIQDKINTY